MYLSKKKQRGFILIEAMVVMVMAFLVISMYIKRIVWNIEKGALYTINSDLLAINENELVFIDEVTKVINNDMDLKTKLKDEEKFNEIKYEYYLNNIGFEITKGKVFLIEKINNDTLYRKMKLLQLTDDFIIIPEYYKGYNLTY